MARVEIEGLNEVLARLQPARYAGPLRDFFKRSVIEVEGRAKKDTPVDTGRLRSSITHDVDASPIPAWGQVGTNVEYGIYVHEGTRPHFPPPAALEGWARRHGFGEDGGFLVARSIARRGAKPKPFLRDALSSSIGAIRSFTNKLAADIEAKF